MVFQNYICNCFWGPHSVLELELDPLGEERLKDGPEKTTNS